MEISGNENISVLIEYIRHRIGKARIGWHGQRALDCLTIDPILPVDFIVSCDYGMDVRALESTRKIFSIERKHALREVWSNESMNQALLNGMRGELESYLSDFSGINFIVCYRSTPALESMEKESGNVVILSMANDIKSFFDDKIRLRENLSLIGLPVIPGITGKLADMEYDTLTDILGSNFILQFPIGSSGNASYVIRHRESFENIKKSRQDATVVSTKYMDGISLNINACVCSSDTGVHVIPSYPSVQIIGARGSSHRALDYCGNDFSFELKKEELDIIFEAVRRIGHLMHDFGWKGIFGLDLIWYDGKPYVIDLNPRFQGSTQLLVDIQLNMGLVPITLLHLLEYIDGNLPDALIERAKKEAYISLKGAQLILHSLSEVPTSVKTTVPAGVYASDGNEIVMVKDALTLSSASVDQFVLTSGNPFRGLTVVPGATFMKMHTWNRIRDEKNGINEGTQKLVKLINRLLINGRKDSNES